MVTRHSFFWTSILHACGPIVKRWTSIVHVLRFRKTMQRYGPGGACLRVSSLNRPPLHNFTQGCAIQPEKQLTG